VAVPVPELLGVAVCDDEGVDVCDGVCVGVMLGARKHGRTLSTSSTDGSNSSIAFATRMVRLCAPADGRLTLKRAQPLLMYGPTLSMLVLYSTVSTPLPDDRKMSTMCAESLCHASSMPSHCTSSDTSVSAGATRGNVSDV